MYIFRFSATEHIKSRHRETLSRHSGVKKHRRGDTETQGLRDGCGASAREHALQRRMEQMLESMLLRTMNCSDTAVAISRGVSVELYIFL